MALPPIAEDFALCVDNLVPIKLTLRGATIPLRVTHAHRNQVQVSQHRPTNGSVRQGDTIWQFPISESTDPIPLGSTIQLDPDVHSRCVDDVQIWTILAINKQVWSSKWEAHCRDLSIDSGLDTTATVLQASYLANSDGEPIPTWSILLSNVRARFQRATQENQVHTDTDDLKQIYEVTLALQPGFEPTVKHRLKDSDGKIYGILDVSQESRIDALPKLRCRILDGYTF